MDDFVLSAEQCHWLSRPHQHVRASELRRLLTEQRGLCALSQAPLLFGTGECTPQKGGLGCHPLCAAVDHRDPGNAAGGYQIVCYALNDLKGHLPLDCFEALCKSEAWKRLMIKWKEQAERDSSDRLAFARLLRPNANQVLVAHLAM